MTRVLLGIGVVSLALVVSFSAQGPEALFRPYAHSAYDFVNAVAFSPDGSRMYHASFLARVAAHRGQSLAAGAPELGIFESRRAADGTWGEPSLLPFSGRDQDYEPTISPDGSFMIFNSRRPLPDIPARADMPNNLWLSRRTATDDWTAPVSLAAINRPDTEESYPSIAADGRVFYVQQVTGKPGGSQDYDIYVARLDGDRVSAPAPVAVAATDAGEGDPWVAPDGSYLIFTRWDRAADWGQVVDLYITFATGEAWTPPIPLAAVNRAGAADYSVTITSGPDARFYWRRGGTMFVRPAAPIITAARAAARGTAGTLSR